MWFSSVVKDIGSVTTIIVERLIYNTSCIALTLLVGDFVSDVMWLTTALFRFSFVQLSAVTVLFID
jgi:hypothetical protein